MSNHFDHIPYAELNRFYTEIVSQMHVSLRPLATDLRVLRHDAVERHTDSIAEELYQPQYSYVPWMVAEYFDLPADVLLTIGKAWWLTIIDVVITDQMVDRQLPDIAEIPLMLQHLRIQANRQYRHAFRDGEPFWQRYEAALAGVWDALAHETYCVDQHQRVYSVEEMRHVCKLRSDLIGMIITSMSDLAGQPNVVAPLCQFYENLTFADQLLDDASDWKGDFAVGRYTLPIVMASEAAQIEPQQLTLDQLELVMDQHRILIQLSERATALLQEGQAALASLGHADAPLLKLVGQRLEVAAYATKRYNAMRMMTGFLHKLEHG